MHPKPVFPPVMTTTLFVFLFLFVFVVLLVSASLMDDDDHRTNESFASSFVPDISKALERSLENETERKFWERNEEDGILASLFNACVMYI